MKFNEAWGNLSLEKKQAIAKRVAWNYLVFIIFGFSLGFLIANIYFK